MKINYVIATYNGDSKRGKNYPFFNNGNFVLKLHLNRLFQLQHNLSQITVMKPESDNYFDDYYNSDLLLDKSVITHSCENFGYSMGQWLKAYEIYKDQFDYYCFIEDDYCANLDNFDLIFSKIYQEKFPNNIGVLASVVEGSKDYAQLQCYPPHSEGVSFISSQTLSMLYNHPLWEGDPRKKLDQIDSNLDGGFKWELQRNSYIGGYYQVAFAHLFTLAGIKHDHYLKLQVNDIVLEHPYWSDGVGEFGGAINFYNNSSTTRSNFTLDDITSSPIVPIQLSTSEGINSLFKTQNLNYNG